MIDSEGTFCCIWNFGITIVTIYTLIVVPFIFVFNDQYQIWNTSSTGERVKVYGNTTLEEIEYLIDIIYCIEIILNFFKKSFAFSDLRSISLNYIK